MFNFKRRPRRTGLRAALLAGAAVAAIGAGGVDAGTAAATVNCMETTVAGTALQRLAQIEIWGPSFCTAGTLKYEGMLSDQEALDRWGASGGAFQATTQIPVIDVAPNVTQFGNMRARAGGGTQGVLTIPLAQVAIAVVAHPPTGCVVSTFSQAKLQEVMSGEVHDWSTFGCASATINRVVREEQASTTYLLKHYLGQIFSGTVKCSGGKTWFELGEANPNNVWPESAKCTGTEAIPAGAPTRAEGTGVAAYVNETAGTIGYASLPEVQGKANVTTLSLQNNTGTATFGFPSTTTAADVKAGKARANCELSSKIYNLPSSGGKELSEWRFGGAAGTDWSHVFGTDPMIRETLEGKSVKAAEAQTAYPLCALTYAVGLTHYLKAGIAEAKANLAIGLLRYEVEGTQQTSLVNAEKGYGRLFSGPGPFEAAGEAVNKLGL